MSSSVRRFQISRVFVIGYFLLACMIFIIAGLQPGKEGKVAVFSTPWSDPAAVVIARAGGRIVSAGMSDWIAVGEMKPDGVVSDLYRNGAFFVASSIVASACLNFAGLDGN